MKNPMVSRALAVLLVLGIAGIPQAVAQSARSLPDAASHSWQERQEVQMAAVLPPPQTETQQTPEEDPQQPPADPQTPTQVDPTEGPLQPVPTEEELEQPQTERFPEAPGAQPQTTRIEQQQAPAPRPPEPAGTAAAERGPVAGGAASKPAGTAIAPAKQRQVRSFLIKLGAVVAGAAALGTVYALSKSSPSTPPGSDTTGTRR